MLRAQSAIHPDRVLPRGPLASEIQAQRVHLGRSHVRRDRWYHLGTAGYCLLLVGRSGAHLWFIHVVLRQHHLLPHGDVQTCQCGDLQPYEPNGRTGNGSQVASNDHTIWVINDI